MSFFPKNIFQMRRSLLNTVLLKRIVDRPITSDFPGALGLATILLPVLNQVEANEVQLKI